jgi:FkbM family methyltransferase
MTGRLRSVAKRAVRALDVIAPSFVLRLKIWAQVGYEPEIELLPALIRQHSIAIDVGANWGIYAWHMLHYARQCYLFEPNPGLAARLRRAFGSRACVEAVGLSDCDGEATLRVPAQGHGLGTLRPAGTLHGDGVESSHVVQVRRLDDYELSDVSVMKIDVEGHEEHVLRGARTLILRERPALLVEMEERYNPGVIARVRALLEDQGYAGYFLKRGRLLPISAFDATQDQRVETIRTDRPQTEYLNNFLFVQDSQLKVLADAAPTVASFVVGCLQSRTSVEPR